MRSLILILLWNATYGVPHSLKYIYTSSSQVPNFPEFVTVGMVDDAQISYYDSNSRRAEPKQGWMSSVTEGDADYWERETALSLFHQKWLKDNIDIFNHTGGVHVVQWMFGCEWDDETKETTGFKQFGYDGEDLIALDLKTETWLAPRQEAVRTKQKLDHDSVYTTYWKNYLTQTCVEWLKKYVNYGRSSLLRTELPSVSLLQKTPSSPVSCHATGFYPVTASLVWRKDGQELHEGVDHGEILTNPDGTFQTSVDLDLSSVKPEEWSRYDCTFQLSGVKNDIIAKLETNNIRSNQVKPVDMTVIIIISAVVVLLALIAVFGFMVWKKKQDLEKPPLTPTTESVCSTKPLFEDWRSDSGVSSTGSTSSNESLSEVIQVMVNLEQAWGVAAGLASWSGGRFASRPGGFFSSEFLVGSIRHLSTMRMVADKGDPNDPKPIDSLGVKTSDMLKRRVKMKKRKLELCECAVTVKTQSVIQT